MKQTLFAAALILIGTSASALEPQAIDHTQQFANAGVTINGLRALEIGGIVVLRGDTEDPALSQQATEVAHTLGYARVANLIRVVDAPDDAQIERLAERRLATRALDGCKFRVDSRRGVVTVDGKVQYELQKDVALSILRNIDGVRTVRASLQR